MAQQNSSEEIDLGYLFRKANDFLKGVVRSFFSILDFFKRFWIVIIALVIIGFGYGYYKDSNHVESYNNEVIVIPNYGSVDYLYDKLEATNLKLASGDTIFLQKVFGDGYLDFQQVTIEPIADIYNFVSQSRENIDIFRIIADKQDFSEYLEDISTSKYFKYHRMKFVVSGNKSSKGIIENYIAFLNENEHYREYQKIFEENKAFEIQEYYTMITQIDSLIKFSSRVDKIAASVEINNTTDQHFLIDRKKVVLQELGMLKMEQADYSAPIKMVNADYNLKTGRFLSISNKLLYPIFLVIGFSMLFYFIHLFKSLKKYAYSR